MNRSSSGHPSARTKRNVAAVGTERRIIRSDRSTSATETRTLDARRADVEPEGLLVVEAPPPEEEDEPLGWLISLLIEYNAREARSGSVVR
jgi:hypothetical protein